MPRCIRLPSRNPAAGSTRPPEWLEPATSSKIRSMPPLPLSILVAEDHSHLRKSLCRALSTQMDVIGTAIDGPDVYEKALRLKPDVILMDYRLPLMNGVEATREIRSKTPLVRIVAHSAFSDPGTIEAMFEAGAVRFIVKGSSDIWNLAHDLSFPRCVPGCGTCSRLRSAKREKSLNPV